MRVAAGFLFLVLLAGNSCSRPKEDPQAALDHAFQAGLLTKDEYDAKKAAFAATAAAPAPLPAPAVAPSASPGGFALAEPVFVQDGASPAKQAPLPPPPTPQASSAPAVAASATSRVGTSSSVATPSNAATPFASNVPPPTPASSNPSVSPGREPEPAAAESEPAPLPSCQDEEFKSGGRKGRESRFFAASLVDVRRAAENAFGSLNFNVHKNTSQQMEAIRKRNIGVIVGASGERVVLRFQHTTSEGQAGTLVTGDTKKNFVGRVTQRTWTDAVLAEMACKLRESGR
jgi:hypothetical protein